MTVTFSSNQDFATDAARVAAITLQGDTEFKAWRAESFRNQVNSDYAWFTKYLHQAMGYRADQGEY